jgi:hypothetical protein
MLAWVRSLCGGGRDEEGEAWGVEGDDEAARAASLERAERKLATFGPRLRMELDLEGERVSVSYSTPSGRGEMRLGGWTLLSAVGGGQKFTFPADARIAAGSTVQLWSGRSADTLAAEGGGAGGGHFVFARRNVWNNGGDVADLLDETGSRVLKVAAGAAYERPSVHWGSVAVRGSSPRVTVRLDLLLERVDVVFEAPSDAVNLDLAGWAVVSNRGAQRFVFPAGTVIPPGASASVWSGRDAEESKRKSEARVDRVDGSVDLVFTRRFIWNNEGDSATLVDAYGTSVVTVHAGKEFHAASLAADSNPVNIVSPPSLPHGRARSTTPVRARDPRLLDLGPFVRVDTLRNDDRSCTIA